MMNEPALYGLDLFGHPIEPPTRGALADEFLVPPFTVMSAREGWWQDRKRAWICLGIKSEIGRGGMQRNDGFADATAFMRGDCGFKGDGKPTTVKAANASSAERYGVNDHLAPQAQRALGCYAAYGEAGAIERASGQVGASIFDPVLCELSYRWFCPPGGHIIDPFAGGSVRGIVASLLGRNYTGIELRPEQIASNREQAAAICNGNQPVWIEGDAADIQSLTKNAPADFLFSCPPYGDLEVYSDDPRDLSTLPWDRFAEKYRAIIKAACFLLKFDAFACFVVGNFRNARGNYNDLCGLTIDAFSKCGLALYNEAILVTAVGSLPVRITKQFSASRKLGKTHQNVLVFVKGDGERAAAAINR